MRFRTLLWWVRRAADPVGAADAEAAARYGRALERIADMATTATQRVEPGLYEAGRIAYRALFPNDATPGDAGVTHNDVLGSSPRGDQPIG